MTDPTVAGMEAALNFDSIKEVMDGIDPEAMLPEMSSVLNKVFIICRVAVIIGPIILLLLGLIYLFLAPKEANYYLGYRCYFGMGSMQAWQFTQRLAGIVFTGLGAVLTLIMLILSAGFSGMEMMAMVWRAVWCLTAQAVLALIATVGINCVVVFWFNQNGELRKRTPREKK